MKIVLDAASFLSFILEDEFTAGTEAMIGAVEAFGAVVPAIWLYEIENALLMAERAGRIDRDGFNSGLEAAKDAKIAVEALGPEVVFGGAAAAARKYGLSVYDAAYLDLAYRRNIPLMTLDKRLFNAASDLQLAWDKGYSPLVASRRGSRYARR